MFYNVVTAINQIWDWGFTYQSISVINCTVGLDMSNGNVNPETVGDVTIFDSTFTNSSIAVKTSRVATTGSITSPFTGGSLALENVQLTNVSVAIQLSSTKSTLLAGTTGNTTITWISGLVYNPHGTQTPLQGNITVNPRSTTLLTGNGYYYQRSKPQYNALANTSFISVRTAGAVGDGLTDDTTAIQTAINSAGSSSVVFFDAGVYKVSSTIRIPAGARVVGEGYSVIMANGTAFNSIALPQPVVQVGNPGDTGVVEWSDMIVSTQGSNPGAILIAWNLAATASQPSGMWDVHTRVGGFTGSLMQKGQCASNPSVAMTMANVNVACEGAFMSMFVNKSATALYMENVWLWTADHDVDDPGLGQLNVYNGRGLLINSATGVFWVYASPYIHPL